MAFSDTCEPTTNLRLTCFSIRCSCSWSSFDVNPSTPVNEPVMAADIVETLNSLKASLMSESPANGLRRIFAIDSEILMTASSCLTVIGIDMRLPVSRSCWTVPDLMSTYCDLSFSAASSPSLGPHFLKWQLKRITFWFVNFRVWSVLWKWQSLIKYLKT